MEDNKMNVLEDLRQELQGQKICRIQYWRDKTLAIGLGEKRPASAKGISFYGQWEIGTYNASWRIVREGKILIASESEELLAEEKEIVSLPAFELEKIIELTKYDVSFIFSNNFEVDFFNCYTEADEFIHVLRKDDRTWWEKDRNGIWKKGKDPEKPSVSVKGVNNYDL